MGSHTLAMKRIVAMLGCTISPLSKSDTARLPKTVLLDLRNDVLWYMAASIRALRMTVGGALRALNTLTMDVLMLKVAVFTKTSVEMSHSKRIAVLFP